MSSGSSHALGIYIQNSCVAEQLVILPKDLPDVGTDMLFIKRLPKEIRKLLDNSVQDFEDLHVAQRYDMRKNKTQK